MTGCSCGQSTYTTEVELIVEQAKRERCALINRFLSEGCQAQSPERKPIWKKKRKEKKKLALFILLSVIQVSEIPKIPVWFEKMLFEHFKLNSSTQLLAKSIGTHPKWNGLQFKNDILWIMSSSNQFGLPWISCMEPFWSCFFLRFTIAIFFIFF